MEQEKIPKYLFVTKINEDKIRTYRFISKLSYGKYLYEDMDKGFKECFLHADIFSGTRAQNGYAIPTYKAQKRNETVRKRRRRKGEVHGSKLNQFRNQSVKR